LLSIVMAEQHARAETIRRLVVAIDEQRARLDRQLSQAVEMLAQRGALQFPAPADYDLGVPRTTVRCLGTLHLEVDGAAVSNWRSGKARALFQYLVNHRGQPTSRDVLIEALWPDPDAVAAGTSLKVAVHALRQMLNGTGGSQPVLSIVAHDAGYQLQSSTLWLDVDEFERSCTQAGQLERQGHTNEALSLWEQAAELYHGDFLADGWDDWIVFRREGLKDQYLYVLARLADAALEAGDCHTCIRRCRQLLDQDRCREETFRTLMLCHARLGQPGRVRRWYQLCVRTLRTELDVEPEAETVSLFERALRMTARAGD